eukprot:6208866-Pleurochrysis_carterae.AAC.2
MGQGQALLRSSSSAARRFSGRGGKHHAVLQDHRDAVCLVDYSLVRSQPAHLASLRDLIRCPATIDTLDGSERLFCFVVNDHASIKSHRHGMVRLTPTSSWP